MTTITNYEGNDSITKEKFLRKTHRADWMNISPETASLHPALAGHEQFAFKYTLAFVGLDAVTGHTSDLPLGADTAFDADIVAVILRREGSGGTRGLAGVHALGVSEALCLAGLDS